MTSEQAIGQLKATKEFFDRSTRCLEEKHSTYSPAEGMFTVAQQIAHVAQTVEWFLDGARSAEGFDLDEASHLAALKGYTSIKASREWLEKAFAKAEAYAKSSSPEELMTPIVDGPVMGGMPRFVIFPSIDEHTAHHRGALTVYSRMLGLTPAMPYMEMDAAPSGS